MTFSGIGFMVVPWLVGVVASATYITAGMGMLAALSVLLVTLAAIMRTRQE